MERGLLIQVFVALILGAECYRVASWGASSARGVRWLAMSNINDDGSDGGNQGQQAPPRSKIPQRRDTMRVIVSGVLGADPKETYLSNDHYVINFPLAVTGHFAPLHDWEMYKPTETMWLSSEVWDDQAKNNQVNFKKGAPVCGMGYLIHNTWKDKVTGEDRKQFKMRFTNILTPEDMADILGSGGIEDLLPSPTDGDVGSDSAFASESPPMSDQSFRNKAPPMQRMQAGGATKGGAQRGGSSNDAGSSYSNSNNSSIRGSAPVSRRGELDEDKPDYTGASIPF